MKVAVAKYPVSALRDFESFAAKQEHLLGQARQRGAQLAVLPEYLALEMADMFGDSVRSDFAASLAALQPLHAQWLQLFARLARSLRMQINAGTFLLASGANRYRNRSYLLMPDGSHVWQDKLRLTGFEKASGLIESGDALKVVELGRMRAAISVCYDIEFPLPVRAQCEAGARLLLVPSCTDTNAGATRVRVGCLARALENRCFVAQSVTSGSVPWNPALDHNTGEAALIAPMDVGLPCDGLLAQTRGDQNWAIAELDFDALDASRLQAQVANDRDWSSQYFPTIMRARVEHAQMVEQADAFKGRAVIAPL